VQGVVVGNGVAARCLDPGGVDVDGDAMKVLFFDGTGICIFYKRLDKGRLRWPEAHSPDAQHVEVGDAELMALLGGIELERKSAPKVH
jgi:transposase